MVTISVYHDTIRDAWSASALGCDLDVPTFAEPCCATSSGCSTNRRSTSPLAGWPASRRSCAGEQPPPWPAGSG
jgi:hypothetical protein